MWWVRGGWVDRLVWHRPITVRCIGFGAVLQRWWYWWCGVARMVGILSGGWLSQPAPYGVCQDLPPDGMAQNLVSGRL